MTRVIMSGCCGRMGKCIVSMCDDPAKDCKIAAGVDITKGTGTEPYPIYEKISDVTEEADVIIDFSFHGITSEILAYAEKKNIPVVLCTTGHTPEELEEIKEYSKKVAIFKSANMSVGISLITELCKRAAALLGADYDIELIEKHHNQKLDAPSGTALMIANAINNASDSSYEYIYDRSTRREKRGKKELGISCVRAGTIVGEHEVIFGGRDEIITISHSALSRDVFAAGALRAGIYMSSSKKAPGIYDMEKMLNEQFM